MDSNQLEAKYASHENTFPKLLRANARMRGARPSMRHKYRGYWHTWTWAEVYENVLALAHALESLGAGDGDKIAIVGGNRPLMYWSISAAQILRAIPVPVYADATPDEMAAVIDDAQIKIAVVQDQEQVDKLIGAADRLPSVKFIFYDEERGLVDYDHARLKSMKALMDESKALFAREPSIRARLVSSIDAGQGGDTSIMLYTSGTTGRSKGVILSAERCVAAARDTAAFDRLNDRDEVLAYLPCAWVGDHYLNYAQAMVAGICMACPESGETVQQDLREIGPTFYFAPPRVFEGLLTRVMIRMEDASKLKQRMFHYYLGIARKWGEKILNQQRVPLLARLQYAIGEVLVYGPLKNVLGFSRVRVAYTAGEAIGNDLFAFYRSLGINLKQLYGQTEAFLYVTCQPDGAVRSDTVGPPAPNVTIRISEDGEVQFKSPGQFIGYYNDPQKTRETVTEDDFVRTGDAGIFDKDGQLRIIDRAKDVGKLKDGRLFAPKYIENKLKFFPNIKEAVAFGDGCEFTTAFINIDLTAVGNWAERNNIIYSSYQELAGHRQVYDMIAGNVAEVNASLAAEPMMLGGVIKRFLILHKELDADDGELTRTQKVRRGFVGERYGPLITALYDGSYVADISTEVTFEDGRRGTISARLRIQDMQDETSPRPLEKAA